MPVYVNYNLSYKHENQVPAVPTPEAATRVLRLLLPAATVTHLMTQASDISSNTNGCNGFTKDCCR